MRLRNISRSENSKALSDAIEKGSFSIPHILFDLRLASADLLLLAALFKLQDDFLSKSGKLSGWFFATAKHLSKLTRRSKKTLKRSRQYIKRIGLIDYRLGQFSKRKATEYRILLDRFYLAEKAQNIGVNYCPHKSKSK